MPKLAISVLLMPLMEWLFTLSRKTIASTQCVWNLFLSIILSIVRSAMKPVNATQEYALAHGRESRFEEIKVRKEKRVQLGPHIKFDGDRCIMCSRCIRFSDEIVKKNQLTFVQRGDKVTITTFPGESFDNPYTLNTTDICPVGALTNQDFRFKSRVWEMSKTNSVCVGCSRGCNTEVWVRNNEILRLTPRQNGM